jgi:diguanylate cyclase (GGDEF)-like protein/PAS domain S-box-containing protein
VRIARAFQRFGSILPVSRRLLLIIWPFLAIVVLLVVLAMVSVDILSAGRAYVGGESLWSKAQKDAVYFLTRYAQTRSEEDYLNFRRALQVPLGDRVARIELQKDDFDRNIARQGLLDGRTHPDDIPGVVRLFRSMNDVSYMKKVIELWEEGDRHVLELDYLGQQIHARLREGDTAAENLQPFVDRVHALNAEISPLSDAFSYTLGEANRALRVQLLTVILAAAILLIPAGVALSRQMMKRGEAFERALRVSEERFKLAVSGTNDGVWDWNIPADDLYCSPRFRELLRLNANEAVGRFELVSRLHPEDQTRAQAVLQTHLKQGEPFDVELRLLCSAEYKWFRVRGQSVRGAGGRAVRMAGSISDITDKKLADAQVFAEKERAEVTLASIGDAVITTDSGGRVEYLNPMAETLTGWKDVEARGMHLAEVFKVIDETTREVSSDLVDLVLHTGRIVSLSASSLLTRRDGVELAINKSAAPIRDRAGRITGVVVVFQDVSPVRQYAARLSYQASHDALTGLINRHEFEHRLSLALKSSSQYGRSHSLLYLDLDQFKLVNDTCGHAAGDELMRQISALLQSRLREGDTLARLGGDEFGVLLENCPPEHALRISDEIRQSIRDFRFSWNGRPFTVGVSIGVVSLGDAGHTLAEVLRAADTACYVAKEKGRNRVHVYHADDSEVSMRQGEMEWVSRIQHALDQGRFRLYAQEIFSLGPSLKRGAHFELLLRMLGKDGEIILPGAFIPAAERYGLMPAVDRWVVATAFDTYAQFAADLNGRPIELCSINLSGASIGDEAFLEFLQTQAAVAGVPYSAFCFEVTETAAVADLGKASHFIGQLKALGCRFSLDDFGAGMSSFGYLKHLPVDYLKIDGSFVKDMLEDPMDRAMVEAINHIGHVMGKKTIAEFVENVQTLEALRTIGVDYGQGFGLAKPVPFGTPAWTDMLSSASPVTRS